MAFVKPVTAWGVRRLLSVQVSGGDEGCVPLLYYRLAGIPGSWCVLRDCASLIFEENALKASALRELTEDELGQKYDELTEELFNLRFQLATSQMENVGRMRAVRQDIARVKTIQRERQLLLPKQD